MDAKRIADFAALDAHGFIHTPEGWRLDVPATKRNKHSLYFFKDDGGCGAFGMVNDEHRMEYDAWIFRLGFQEPEAARVLVGFLNWLMACGAITLYPNGIDAETARAISEVVPPAAPIPPQKGVYTAGELLELREVVRSAEIGGDGVKDYCLPDLSNRLPTGRGEE